MPLDVVTDEQTPEGVLKEMQTRAEHFEGVICIALNKDGSQFLMSSRMRGREKAFLIAFAQSWVMDWFDEGRD